MGGETADLVLRILEFRLNIFLFLVYLFHGILSFKTNMAPIVDNSSDDSLNILRVG